jgi:lipopolysaccharide transport system ATP-binding protein
MRRAIVEVRGVSKAYTLGTIGATSLKDELARLWVRMRTGEGRARSAFWALSDVSFEVEPGEVVGIIGRNGAGKSTLLKLLSRITRPTAGAITLRGRVASLLEVGTGFHPDLTGRDNIFLNGAILGMQRAEIRRKFDDIVAFAEVDAFIDTPVKRYSSGMYVRLAFAVAAHLEPEILIVDEVLAVGDAAFQAKCLGKINEVSGRNGRTVLFVSHNMAAVQSLCGRGIFLDAGRVVAEGDTAAIVAAYQRTALAWAGQPLESRADRTGHGRVRFTTIRIESADGGPVIRSTSRLRIVLGYRGLERLHRPAFLVGIYDYTNQGIYALRSDTADGLPFDLPAEGTVTVVTDPINLTPGPCYLNIALLKDETMADYLQHAATFEVAAPEVGGGASVPSREWVLCVLKHEWSCES